MPKENMDKGGYHTGLGGDDFESDIAKMPHWVVLIIIFNMY